MSWISVLLAQAPYGGLFVLIILGGVGLPFPEDATLILCGVLIATEVVRPAPALLLVYSGLLATDVFLHLLGKKYGQMIVEHKRIRKIISPERFALLKEKFDRWGVVVILVGRHMLGLRAQIFLVSGVTKMPLLKFLMADAFSSLFTIAIMVGAGYVGGNSAAVLLKDVRRVEHIAVVVAVAVLTAYVLYRYVRPGGRKPPREG